MASAFPRQAGRQIAANCSPSRRVGSTPADSVPSEGSRASVDRWRIRSTDGSLVRRNKARFSLAVRHLQHFIYTCPFNPHAHCGARLLRGPRIRMRAAGDGIWASNCSTRGTIFRLTDLPSAVNPIGASDKRFCCVLEECGRVVRLCEGPTGPWNKSTYRGAKVRHGSTKRSEVKQCGCAHRAAIDAQRRSHAA